VENAWEVRGSSPGLSLIYTLGKRSSFPLLQVLAKNILFIYLFLLDEGPSHHSLKAFCATPIKLMRMSSSFTNFYN
jgi:hypothetical protein